MEIFAMQVITREMRLIVNNFDKLLITLVDFLETVSISVYIRVQQTFALGKNLYPFKRSFTFIFLFPGN